MTNRIVLRSVVCNDCDHHNNDHNQNNAQVAAAPVRDPVPLSTAGTGIMNHAVSDIAVFTAHRASRAKSHAVIPFCQLRVRTVLNFPPLVYGAFQSGSPVRGFLRGFRIQKSSREVSG